MTAERSLPLGPLPQAEYEAIYSRVPRLTVEVVIGARGRGVLLSLRAEGPCAGLWHLPGGTVRFGEPVTDAVRRVAADELGLAVTTGDLLGYIEYPSHYEHGLDCPVGLAFAAAPRGEVPDAARLRGRCRWFTHLPTAMHDEQRVFLSRVLGAAGALGPPAAEAGDPA
ncbi:MAG TPA: NUDIX domain-containing protein [Trebonia sp.]|nr:NUDIX domain-containing protein [Trebonia sp.]